MVLEIDGMITINEAVDLPWKKIFRCVYSLGKGAGLLLLSQAF